MLWLATGLLIIPLWCVHSPGMPDYPAHLASFALIGGQAPPFLVLRHSLGAIPNLASELTVPLLAKLLPLEAAAKLFLSAAVAMWVLGPGAIQRALFGRSGVTPLAGAFFAYNANFTWGFFNYYFATGLCFLIFAAWIATARSAVLPRLPASRWRSARFTSVIWFAVFLLAVMIGSFESAPVLDEREFAVKTLVRRALPVVLVFLPAAIAYLFFKPAGGLAAANSPSISSIRSATASSAPLKLYFDDPAYLLTGAWRLPGLAGFLYDRLRVHPAMKILVIALAVLTLVAPEWALGGWGVHLRLPAVFGAMLFASRSCASARAWARFAAAALLLLGRRQLAISGGELAGLRPAIWRIPRRARDVPDGTNCDRTGRRFARSWPRPINPIGTWRNSPSSTAAALRL